MNNLSLPAAILLGILLGLVAVAADRTGENEPATDDDPPASADSAQNDAQSDDAQDDDAVEHNPDTGGTPELEQGDDYTVTLTFDDGPHPTYTPKILDVLERHNVTAIFCVVGERVAAHPELVRRIVEAGHALCNHTYTHDEQLSKRDRERVDKEIGDTADAIDAALGESAEVRYFRQPNTHVEPEILKIIDDHGLAPLDWNVDPRDWSRPGVASIVQGVLNEVRPGAVIIMHDGGGDRSQTVEALDDILAGLDAAGYSHVLPNSDKAASDKAA